ncbi:Receptor expression-enhancing protein, putative [Ricinus communis]|uniref:HVA22-like protein n=1 Tax=Ricinus communis TaxID=3988 RepID=B9T730_RICCO|nr:Receptor expression-enhancing protein, putative [Ricinus communis]
MIGSFLSRALIMIFGYAYPAYECFKVVEKTESEMEQLLFWCQYWILVAMLTVCERVGDNLLSWLPMYSEAKLAFFIYLWHQKTRGTMYVYNCFFQPFVRKHETEIDDRLLELRVEGGRMALVYWEKAAIYGQAKLFEILQFASSQSALWCHFGQTWHTCHRSLKHKQVLLQYLTKGCFSSTDIAMTAMGALGPIAQDFL